MPTVPTGKKEVTNNEGIGKNFYGDPSDPGAVKVNSFFNSTTEIEKPEKRQIGLTEEEKGVNKVDQFFGDGLTDTHSKLSIGVKESNEKDTDTAAKQLAISRDFGFSDQYVQDNYNSLLLEQSKSKIDIDSQVKNNPRLSEWIAKSVNHFPLIKNDVDHLNSIESQSNFINGIKTSFNQEEMGFLIYKEMESGLTPAENAKLSELKNKAAELGKNELSGFDKVVNLSGYGVGQAKGSIIQAVKGAGYGATIGAVHGAIGGPLAPVSSSAGAVVGGTAGAIAASFDYSYKLESAFMYDEIREVPNLTKDEKVSIARAVGLVNGAIEVASDAAVVGTLGLARFGIEAVKKYMGKDVLKATIKNALKNRTTARILADAAIKINNGAVINGIEEFVQGMVSSGGKVSAGVDTSLKEEFSDWSQSAFDGYVSSLLTSAAGKSLPLHQELATRRDAKLSHDFFNSLAQGKDSEVVKKLPEKYQEAVNDITKDGPLEHVYVDVEKFDEHFQSQKLDPRETAKQINKDDGKSYDEAKETGGSIKFKTGDYAVKIAQNEKHGPVLNKYARTAPDAMNFVEEQEALKKLEAQPTEEDLKRIETEQKIKETEDEFTKQIKETGKFNERDSRAQAKLFTKMVSTTAQRAGQSIDDVKKRFPLKILSEKFTGQQSDEVFQSQQMADALYSKVEQTINEKMSNAASPQEILAILKDTKQEERDWLGVDDFLKGKNKVSKQEMLDFVSGNQVKIVEVVKGGDPSLFESSSKYYQLEEVKNAVDQYQGGGSIELTLANDGDAYRALMKKFPELENDENWAETVVKDIESNRVKNATGPTKFSEYKILGGENYREILFKLPDNNGTPAGTIEELPNGMFLLRVNGVSDLFDTREQAEKKSQELGNRLNSEKTNFISSHFDEKNIIAHARVNERTDKDGKRVLFIEEIQSDWHQAGRKYGYKVESKISNDELKRIHKALYDKRLDIGELNEKDNENWLDIRSQIEAEHYNLDIKQKIGENNQNMSDSQVVSLLAGIAISSGEDSPQPQIDIAVERIGKGAYEKLTSDDKLNVLIKKFRDNLDLMEKTRSEIKALEDKLPEDDGFKVPNAPFKKTWHEFVLKKLIREASEKGFDKIAWTTGEIQAERYDLSKSISEIHYSGSNLKAYGLNGETVINKTGIREDDLDNYIGKEAAKKLLESPKTGTLRSLVGQDLKIGGEGMKGFYDKILVDAANKLGKKFGAKVSDIKVDGETVHSLPITDALRNQSLNVGFPLFQSDKTVYRGSFSTNGVENIIKLFQDANLSTLLHEGSHFYTQILKVLSEDVNTPESLKKDYDIMKEFGGVDENGNLSAEGNEKIARAFEVYLREGKAPSNDLLEPFRRFKSWLVMLYKSIREGDYFRGIEINDEIRGVFDRMLATEEEIAEVKSKQEIGLSAEAIKSLNLPESKVTQYSILVQEVDELAKEKMTASLIAEQAKEQETEWKAERDQYKKEFEEVFKAEPIHAAVLAIRDGKDIDDNDIPLKTKPKMSKSEIIEKYGQDVLDQLPKWSYRVKDGMSPDNVADIYGIQNGQELINQLISYKSPEKNALEQANQKMKQIHGDLVTDKKALNDEAISALLNEKQDELSKLEFEMLATGSHPLFKDGKRISTKYASNVRFLKEKAKETILNKPLIESDPVLYKRAANKAYKETIKNILDGNKEKAVESKMREIYNWQLYSNAIEQNKDIDKKARKVLELTKDKVRAKIGKAGQDYLELFDSLIAQYGFERISKKKLQSRANSIDFAKFVKSKEENGESLLEEVVYPEFMNQTEAKNYRELTPNEFNGLYDTISQLRYMANQINKFAQEGIKKNREEIKQKMIEQISIVFANKKIKPASKHSMVLLDKAGKIASKFDAMLIKPEEQFDMLDDGDVNGVFRTLLFNTAATNENYVNDLEKELNAKFVEISKKVPKETRKRMSERVEIPGKENERYVRQDLIGIMLNLGNDSNKTKLMLGNDLSESQIEFVKKQITDEEMEYIQGVWDTIESLWPKIEKLHQEVTGLAPPKIEVTPITHNGKTYRGGYYPVMYDREYSQSGELQLADHPGGGLLDPGYNRATTFTGHTKARTNFTARIDLDTDRLLTNISSVIQDLSFRKWAIDANWFLRQNEVKTAFANGPGVEFYDRLREWIGQVLNDRVTTNLQSMAGFHRFINKLSQNISVATMGFKVTTSLTQIAGLSAGVEVIGQSLGGGKTSRIEALKLMSKTLVEFASSPKKTMEFVTGKSGQMKHRMDNMSVEVRDSVRNVRAGANPFESLSKMKAEVTELAMKSVALMDAVVSNIVWLTQYNKSISEGKTDQTAILEGDRAVRLSQGSGASKDLSAIAASKNLKPFVMFYTPFSALYSRMRDAGFKFKRNQNAVDLAGAALMASVVPAVLSEILSARTPDEDKDETWLGFISKAVLSYNFAAIPIVRDIVNSSLSGFGYSVSPIQKVGETTTKTVKTAWEVFLDEESDKEIDDLLKSSIDTSVYLLGFPAASQLKITGGYLVDIYEGEEQPDNMIQFSRDLVFRREK